MNIRSIAFLDTSFFQSALIGKYRQAFAPSTDPLHHGLDILPLTANTLREWKSGRALLSRIKAGAAPFFDGKSAELGDAAVLAVKPGAWIDWHADEGEYAESHLRLHLCIVPSPGAYVFCGIENAILPVGQIVFVNHRVLHSEINVGDYTTYKLVVDVKRPDADT